MTRRSLAEIEAEFDRLDAEMRPYGSLDAVPRELVDRMVDLTDGRDYALNAGDGSLTVAPRGAA